MVQTSLSLILGTVVLIATSTFAIPIRNLEARDVDAVSSLAARAARPRPPASKPAAKHHAPVKQVKQVKAGRPQVKATRPQVEAAIRRPQVKATRPQVKGTRPHLVKPGAPRPKQSSQGGFSPQSFLGGVGKAAKDVKNVADKVIPVAKDVMKVAEKAAPFVEKVAPVVGKVLPVVEKALPFAEKFASWLRRELAERDGFDEDELLSRELDIMDELD